MSQRAARSLTDKDFPRTERRISGEILGASATWWFPDPDFPPWEIRAGQPAEIRESSHIMRYRSLAGTSGKGSRAIRRDPAKPAGLPGTERTLGRILPGCANRAGWSQAGQKTAETGQNAPCCLTDSTRIRLASPAGFLPVDGVEVEGSMYYP